MEKHKYQAKTREEAINNAKAELQEVEENLFIKEISEEKGGLFKSKKVEIEVIEKRELIQFIKEYIQNTLKQMGFKRFRFQRKYRSKKQRRNTYLCNIFR